MMLMVASKQRRHYNGVILDFVALLFWCKCWRIFRNTNICNAELLLRYWCNCWRITGGIIICFDVLLFGRYRWCTCWRGACGVITCVDLWLLGC